MRSIEIVKEFESFNFPKEYMFASANIYSIPSFFEIHKGRKKKQVIATSYRSAALELVRAPP